MKRWATVWKSPLVIAHPDVYCAHTVQGYADILAATINDSTMDGKATGISVIDGILWVNVEVSNNADS